MSKITFEEAAAKAIEFRNERDWKQFHNPKDLAISISLDGIGGVFRSTRTGNVSGL